MATLIKWILGLVLVLVVMAVVVVPMVVDPNDYKDEITAQVEKATGRTLTIGGDISLAVFPWIAVEMSDVTLSNAKGFGDKPFAALKQIDVRLKLLPLLKKNIELDTLVLHGLELNLAKSKKGTANWDDMAGDKKKESSPSDAGSNESSAGIKGFSLGGIDIQDARIVWADRQAGTEYVFDNLRLQTGKVTSGEPVDLKLAFDLGSKEPHLQTRLQLETLLKVTGNSVDLSNLVASMDDSKLTGSLAVADFASAAVRFDLNVDAINLDRYASGSSGDTGASDSTAKSSNSRSDDEVIPVNALKGLNMKGVFTIGRLTVAGATASDARIEMDARGGLVKLKQSVGSFYEGKYNGSLTVDVRGRTPKIAISSALDDLNVGPLLLDMTEKDTLTGTGKYSSSVTARGSRMSAIKKSLNGKGQFAFTDGAVKGVNIAELIRTAQAKLKGESAPDSGEQKTDFSSLSGSYTITSGVVNNSDLKMNSPFLRISGEGSANLANEQLNYLVRPKIVGSMQGQGGSLDDLKGVEIPVRISGSFSDPKYGVDLKAALGSKVKAKVEEQKDKLKEKLKDKLKDKFGDKFKGFF